MKIFYHIAIFLWLCSDISYSQIITIIDNESMQPIQYATIWGHNTFSLLTTNSDGRVDISGLRHDESMEIRMVGYKTITILFDTINEPEYTIALTPYDLSLNEVVISASRWGQASENVPVKIASISPRQYALQNPQNAADFLGISGKVFIQKSQQGGGSPMIRGFSANRLLYSVDGVRMNTAIFRSGNLQNVISLDPFSIEHTEVLFGPGSLMYGSDAIGGVMNFQTLTPQCSVSDSLQIAGNAVVRYSSANNEITSHMDIHMGWRKWAFVTSISSYDFDDLRMGSHGPEDYLQPAYVQRQDTMDVVVSNNDQQLQRPTGYSQINLMQKLRFKPGNNWDFQYGFHYSETSPYSRYDRLIQYRNGELRYSEWNYGPQKWMMNNLSILNNANICVYDQLMLRLAVQNFEESRIYRNLNDDIRNIRLEQVNAYSANLDFTKSLAAKHHLYYGLEAVFDQVTSKGEEENIVTNESAVGPSRYPQSTWGSYAVYLNHQYQISKKLVTQAGVRCNLSTMKEEFDTSFYPFPFTSADMNNSALTGSLGLMFHPDSKWSLRIVVSTAFRAPNVDDAGKVFDSEPGSVVVPNPDLEAEYAYNAELGLAKVFGEFLRVELSGFYTYLDNAMVRRDYTLNGQDSIYYDGELSKVQAVQNAAYSKVYGIQAEVDVYLPAGFEFSSGFNFQDGVEEQDDGTTSPSRHTPPFNGVSRVTFSAQKLTIQFYSVYNSQRKYSDMPEEEKGKPELYAKDADGNPNSPSWYTLNLKMMYIITDNFSVSGGIENITDQRYRPYSSGLTAPGRNVILSLKALF
jgi:hemoglobin/transferrin/lactoferrin receptor protein